MKKKKKQTEVNLKGQQHGCNNMCGQCENAQKIGINTFCINQNSSKYGKEIIKPNM